MAGSISNPVEDLLELVDPRGEEEPLGDEELWGATEFLGDDDPRGEEEPLGDIEPLGANLARSLDLGELREESEEDSG